MSFYSRLLAVYSVCQLMATVNGFHSFCSSSPVTSILGTRMHSTRLHSSSKENPSDNENAESLQRKANELRDQIRKMEEQLGDVRRSRAGDNKGAAGVPTPPQEDASTTGKMTLDGKRILVTGSNGRLGSMVCRHLLRNYPKTEVVAQVHYVGEDSPTARGYGRLSYEVGAEDGVGTIGPAWSAEERTATFRYSDEMKDYNLQNLRIVEAELLDPVQCNSIMEGVDSVIWCATDFNGNQPRAVSGLNVAFLFRAVARPAKGRVEIEGLENVLGALKASKQDRRWKGEGPPSPSSADPVNFILVSTTPEAFEDFETPFGSFIGLKRQGEEMLRSRFPSLTSTVVQLGRFDDNFVEESLELRRDFDGVVNSERRDRRLINRRDAARAVVEALLDEELVGKTTQVYTATR